MSASNVADIERGALNRQNASESVKEGFAAVASWIAKDGCGEASIYRKFDDLGSRNLLYLQCDILLLQKKLDAFDSKVSKRGADMDMGLKEAARSWEVLQEQSEANEKDAKEHMDSILTLREKIKTYHEALVLQSTVSGLHQPSERALIATRAWIKQGNQGYPFLDGVGGEYLDTERDFVTLNPHRNIDYLSRKLRDYWPAKTEDRIDGPSPLRIGRFEERNINLAVNIISVAMASVLLLGSITSFYFVQSIVGQLVMIYAFTVAFAVTVCLVTNATRSEIFASTAAYAAVLVVFVSNTKPTAGSSTT